MKKGHLKKWVIILLLILSINLFIFLSFKFNLIIIIDKSNIDITRLILVILSYEATKKSTKELYKRLQEEEKKED